MLKMMFLDMHVSFLVQNDRGSKRSTALQPMLWFIDFVGEFVSVGLALHIQFKETSFLHIHTVFQLFLHSNNA